jgi:transposase
MSVEEFLKQVKDIREYKRAQAVKLDLECYPRKLTAEVLSVSVNFVSKWTPVLALVGGPRVQYNKHGAEGLRLGHKGSKGFLSREDKQQVLEWISEQSPAISRETLEAYLESNYGVSYRSSRSYYQLLDKAGLSYKKRQAVNPAKMSRRCSSDGKSSKKVEQRKAEIEAGELVVVMADECHLLAGDAMDPMTSIVRSRIRLGQKERKINRSGDQSQRKAELLWRPRCQKRRGSALRGSVRQQPHHRQLSGDLTKPLYQKTTMGDLG